MTKFHLMRMSTLRLLVVIANIGIALGCQTATDTRANQTTFVQVDTTVVIGPGLMNYSPNTTTHGQLFGYCPELTPNPISVPKQSATRGYYIRWKNLTSKA